MSAVDFRTQARDPSALVAWLRANVLASAQLTLDSRAVVAGDVFLAYPGARSDGRDYLRQALAQGAAAVVYEAAEGAHGAEIDAVLAERGVPACAFVGLKEALGETASAWYGEPSKAMTVIAVTGTNGKTSCTQWLADALTAHGQPCGVIGTLGIRTPTADGAGAHVVTGLTTPDAVALHRSLAQMRAAGTVAVAIEASSIGIAEGRMDGLHVDVAVLTNLTRDHLDYHGDMAEYERQKTRLFTWKGVRAAIVNLDDPAGHRVLEAIAANAAEASAVEPVALTGFTLDAASAVMPAGVAVLSASDLHGTSQGMVFTLNLDDRSVQIATHLLGAHNVANLLAVGGVLRALGWSVQDTAGALGSAQAAPGRLEAVAAPDSTPGHGTPLVVVDYAHSPDALERAIDALLPVAAARGGRCVCVFGCGGDRDAGKRPEMGRIAAARADRVVVTSDNPRSESPRAIIEQILAGVPADLLQHADRVTSDIDRAHAIRAAILGADIHDVILLAGKGHESYQEIAGVRQPFSDVDEARKVLAGYPRQETRILGFMSLADATSAMQGVLHGASGETAAAPRIAIHGVSTDSRSVAASDLFIALVGDTFDAHDYVAAVAQAGAAAVVVQRPMDDVGVPQIVVSDTRVALARLAAAWRARFAIPLIGVTGSNGKTTTKEMIASILAAWHGEPARLATRGNLNNEIGVPLTLLRLTPEHQSAVVELGMNHPGEIAQLAHIAAPTVGLVNNAQREHQEFMHTVEAVARENGAVIEHLPPDGVAVFPSDDPHTPIWMALAGARPCLRFGLDGTADVTADVTATGIDMQAFDTRFTLVTPAGSAPVVLAAAGLHNVRNALAAAACALAIGTPLAKVVDGLQAFAPVKGRMQRHALPSGGLLIDDTYNANPDSARAAIDVLASLPSPRVLVLGDMGEVGNDGPAMHREVGEYARACGIDAVFALGDATRDTVAAFNDGQGNDAGNDNATRRGVHADRVEDLAPAIRAVRPASVLVKGSRFMRMERVVAALLAGNDPSNDFLNGTRNAA
ncbi:bifunctional UDP-N-acetylmuramoyl-L-alanyl-D-glutamate--2,6-diaminopimelate ligase MurE/UDP-N-acetylmuramoyl-tripeptide--D-alanyl-D-alanine ligase MurF [Pigmentiphaga litoralis]|uniref:Multifunctional fusion protein n=1 Tax=Pigmentiphaga litoralis TaxID=516702 RepID=A0A7Y9IXH5_9BURK|nr:murE/murF fusion protein [Pigmentiphaga litoralis]NYE84789.1 murE/murF fusion protein [Pigmentiphaga litoralis]